MRPGGGEGQYVWGVVFLISSRAKASEEAITVRQSAHASVFLRSIATRLDLIRAPGGNTLDLGLV